MKCFNRFLTVFILLVSPISAFPETSSDHALGPHVHGVATLQVAIDTNMMTLNFSSPLDNLIGFEHRPRNQAEVAQVQSMINAFYKTNLFIPTPSAQCQLKTVDLESLVIKKKLNAPKPSHEEPAGHADLDAELVYHCKHAKDVRDLQVNLFKTFPNLHQISAEIVSEHGQAAVQLSPTNTQAIW
jgi:hypothetical protein